MAISHTRLGLSSGAWSVAIARASIALCSTSFATGGAWSGAIVRPAAAGWCVACLWLLKALRLPCAQPVASGKTSTAHCQGAWSMIMAGTALPCSAERAIWIMAAGEISTAL